MTYTRRTTGPSGHAIIQVDPQGQNSIVVHPGSNRLNTERSIDEVFSLFGRDDLLLLQNEINNIPYLIDKGRDAGMRVCLNPAPFEPEVLEYPLDGVDTIIANETEALALTGANSVTDAIDEMERTLPDCELIVTLGPRGSRYRSPFEQLEIPSVEVEPVDTTGAGDTFVGFFLAAQVQGAPATEALRHATAAAALCVTRTGAMDSIPTSAEVDVFAEDRQ